MQLEIKHFEIRASRKRNEEKALTPNVSSKSNNAGSCQSCQINNLHTHTQQIFFSHKSNNELKWVKETKAHQLRQQEKEVSWMGGKQEGQTLLTLS
jgi:hypothetical protein